VRSHFFKAPLSEKACTTISATGSVQPAIALWVSIVENRNIHRRTVHFFIVPQKHGSFYVRLSTPCFEYEHQYQAAGTK
jgi:hypothetical protein